MEICSNEKRVFGINFKKRTSSIQLIRHCDHHKKNALCAKLRRREQRTVRLMWQPTWKENSKSTIVSNRWQNKTNQLLVFDAEEQKHAPMLENP